MDPHCYHNRLSTWVLRYESLAPGFCISYPCQHMGIRAVSIGSFCHRILNCEFSGRKGSARQSGRFSQVRMNEKMSHQGTNPNQWEKGFHVEKLS